jgi:hypothetical protein
MDTKRTTGMDALNEELDGKFERLLRLGLAPRARLDYYRKALRNTKSSINLAEFRPIILDILDKLIANTISDPMIYNKTQQNLLRNLKEAIAVSCEEPMEDELIDSIKTLSEAQIRRQGRNLGRKSVGSVAAAGASRVRRGTRKAKAATEPFARKLLNKARKRILAAQEKIAANRQDQAQDQRADQEFRQKQSQAQDKARVY